jgi:hypothetical protein
MLGIAALVGSDRANAVAVGSGSANSNQFAGYTKEGAQRRWSKTSLRAMRC